MKSMKLFEPTPLIRFVSCVISALLLFIAFPADLFAETIGYLSMFFVLFYPPLACVQYPQTTAFFLGVLLLSNGVKYWYLSSRMASPVKSKFRFYMRLIVFDWIFLLLSIIGAMTILWMFNKTMPVDVSLFGSIFTVISLILAVVRSKKSLRGTNHHPYILVGLYILTPALVAVGMSIGESI